MDDFILLNYKLGASFCREVYKNGGVCIYIHESLQFSIIDVLKFCKEKDLEVCFVKVYLPECTVGIINLYRSSSGNSEEFLNELEIMLNSILSNSMELIICGDFNIIFLSDTTHKLLLNSLLATYGLYEMVKFPTRIYNNSI